MDQRDSAVISILEAVETAVGTTATDLPPLSDAVDPDALNALLTPEEGSVAPLSVSFEYAGCVVVVDRERHVTITVADGGVSRIDTELPADGPADEQLAE